MIISIESGAAQPNISNEQINSIPLVMPNEKLISKYNDMMNPPYIQILKNQQESANLAQLRDFLLPLLMNGQVVSTTLNDRNEENITNFI
jgi:type I restriction enzyme S subunit